MKKQIEDVLAAASSNGRYTGEKEVAFQLGVLSGWLARIAKDNWYVQQEIVGRVEKHRQYLESAKNTNGLENLLTGLD